ncbi:MAG: hypothetical protein WCB04_06370 [Mycobacteriales bacterium]
MLSVEERQLLYVLARDYAIGAGAMIDAGCFIGGSTAALAAGVEENPRASAIHSYDLFRLDGAYKEAYPGLVEDIEVGESMLPRFEELLGSRLDHVVVHEGDICRGRWAGDPIEVLFIDICKTWAINDHVVGEFFPALVPGRSVVIQQDLIHEWLPFLTITMGLFRDSFELIGVAAPCSAIYLNTRAIPRSAIPNRLDELSVDRKVELFDRGCAPFTGEDRAVIECARAVLLVNIGRPQEAAAHLESIVAQHPNSERVRYIGDAAGRWLAPQLGR